MSIFRSTMKAIEVGAKILQADGVDNWLKSQGEKYFEKFVADRGQIFFARYRGRNDFLEAFRRPLKNRQFQVSIDKTYTTFKTLLGEISEVVKYAGDFNGDSTFVVPAFLLHNIGFERLQSEISLWAEFNREFPTEMLRAFFFREWRVALLKGLREELQSTRCVLLNERYAIVGIDDEMHWSDRLKGGYYIFYGISKPSKANLPLFKKQIDECNLKKGQLTDLALNANTEAFKQIESKIRSTNSWHDLHMAFIGAREELDIRS